MEQLGRSQDDELFMDEEDLLSSDVMTAADNEIHRRLRRDAAQHSVGSHVIYKRQVLQSQKDYGNLIYSS